MWILLLREVMKTGSAIFNRTGTGLLKGLILPALIIIFLSQSALALRCGNRLVEIGDRKYEVLKLCGEPLFVEKWTDETVLYAVGRNRPRDVVISHISTAHIEEWTYNFGARTFLRFLRFVNGKLQKIELGIKGFPGDMPVASNRSRCGSLVSRGDRKIEVIMKCGEPDVVEYFGEDRISTALERLKREGIFQRHELEVQVEEWTYDLGPPSFLLFMRFENGRVARTESGDYGY
jgi:hypothetical protein